MAAALTLHDTAAAILVLLYRMASGQRRIGLTNGQQTNFCHLLELSQVLQYPTSLVPATDLSELISPVPHEHSATEWSGQKEQLLFPEELCHKVVSK